MIADKVQEVESQEEEETDYDLGHKIYDVSRGHPTPFYDFSMHVIADFIQVSL